VWQITKENVGNAIEVENFLGENVKKIQKLTRNGEKIFKLKTSARSTGKKVKAFDDPLQIICRGCDLPISKTSNSKDGVEVCSIECLITYAKRVHEFDCLTLKAGVDLQRRDYVHPLTVEEKIHLQKQKTSALESMPMSSALVLELNAPAIKDKDDSGACACVMVPIARRMNSKAMASTPMVKPNMPSINLGARFGASTTKEEGGGRACTPMINQTSRRRLM